MSPASRTKMFWSNCRSRKSRSVALNDRHASPWRVGVEREMNGPIDPKLVSAEGQRMDEVLRPLEEFTPLPGSRIAKLPRLSPSQQGAAASGESDGETPAG